MKTTDVLIIGSGIAGATAALTLAKNPGYHLAIITRDPDPCESNMRYAQGGIVHRGPDDGAKLLVKDILAAGAGASLPKVAEILAMEGPTRLEQLLVNEIGVKFDQNQRGELIYGQEAAHSCHRNLHVGDGTGKAIVEALISAMRRQSNIEILSNTTAVDLITYPHHSRNPLDAYAPVRCHGAYVFDRNSKVVHRIVANDTILATGGLGHIYRNNTNPAGAPRRWVGDGTPSRSAYH